MLGYKTSLHKFKKTEISAFSDYNDIKIEVNYNEKYRKSQKYRY